ncbi:hypothetical protein [Flaviaesturariibacter amylovorans]|uniref:Cell division protein FtsQ n=1 Tax=Flaviaesturariibacter amylovorans TaxID=1084520 RepID=A0ABP8HCI0_9BACT
MTKKRLIAKILTLFFWVLSGAGLITLLVAANRRDAGHAVRAVKISIKGDGEQFFIDKADILQLLTKAQGAPVKGRPLEQLDLARLEVSLEKGVWIRNAELWVDSRDVLHVQVTEREPVARVFTTAGTSFYIDSSGQRMPLLEKESARVLVVTGYPEGPRYSRADSVRMQEVKTIAGRVAADDFWKEQLAQLDLVPGGYEAVPVVGNGLIRLGDAGDLERKLARLHLFYKNVLAKTGFDRYAVVDVRFAGQVVGVRRGPVSAVDSIQLQKNIEELLARSQAQMLHDSLAAVEQLAAAAESAHARQTMPLDSIGNRAEPGYRNEPPAAPTADSARRPPAVTPVVTPRTTTGPATRTVPAATVPARNNGARPAVTPANRAAATRSTATPPKATMPARRNSGQTTPPKPAPRRTTTAPTNEY